MAVVVNDKSIEQAEHIHTDQHVDVRTSVIRLRERPDAVEVIVDDHAVSPGNGSLGRHCQDM